MVTLIDSQMHSFEVSLGRRSGLVSGNALAASEQSLRRSRLRGTDPHVGIWITSGWPTTHEVTWPSIVSAVAICRQALPAQLEYTRDKRTLGSDRNHGSIPHRDKDTR
jgi:hypothetical protein